MKDIDLDYIQSQLAALATAMLTSSQETEMVALCLEIPRELINIAEHISTISGQTRDEVLATMCLNNLNSSISNLSSGATSQSSSNEINDLNKKMNELTNVMGSFTSLIDKLNSIGGIK